MGLTGYKEYQQVINLNKSQIRKPKVNKPVATKRRCKTGCLTCRRRKKKCDENTVDGKCQACQRNFLECSWPDVELNSLKRTSSSSSLSSGVISHSRSSSGSSSPYSSASSPKSPINYDDINNSGNEYELKPNQDVPALNINESKFIITSVNRDKSLHHIQT